jgi:endonuclease G
MEVDETTRARGRLALRQAVGAHLFDANVDMVDFGLQESDGRFTGQLAVRIHVHQKLSGFSLESAIAAGRTSEIPPTIGGFPTDVQEGRYAAQQWTWPWYPAWRPGGGRSGRSDPLQAGISISDEWRLGYGTLGGLVRDRTTGEAMLLSNWHVLSGRWATPATLWIVQPGRLDGGGWRDRIAVFARHAMNSDIDAAVARLQGNRTLRNYQLGIGPVTGVRRLSLADLGQVVTKSGRKTGVTRGRFTGTDGIQKMNYGGIQRLVRHVLTIDPIYGQVSDAGDSGSWWLDAGTKQAVGLHFAGSNRPERALAIDMQAVLDALNVNVAV